MNNLNKSGYLTFIILLLLVLTIQNGCTAKDSEPGQIKNEIARKINHTTKTDSFSISISNGGGFTGLKNGYTLNNTGLVRRWHQLSLVKDTTIWEIQTDGIKTKEFNVELKNSGIINKQYNERGNTTFLLTYKLPDTTYSWSWTVKNGKQNIPPEIKIWFKKLTDFLVSLRNNK